MTKKKIEVGQKYEMTFNFTYPDGKKEETKVSGMVKEIHTCEVCGAEILGMLGNAKGAQIIPVIRDSAKKWRVHSKTDEECTYGKTKKKSSK